MIEVTAGFLVAVLILAAILGIRNRSRELREERQRKLEHDAFWNGMTPEQRIAYEEAETLYRRGEISGEEMVRRRDRIWIDWSLGRQPESSK